MVAAVRRGLSLREVARRYRVSVGMVWRWVQRAGTRRLDRVCWESQPRGNPAPRRTALGVEQAVLAAREELRRTSVLGEYGADAISEWLRTQHYAPPCGRTIYRILHRHGLISHVRWRWPAPPAGWYLPLVAQAQRELDAFDFVEGLALAGSRHFDVFTGVSLWGNLTTCRILPHGATLGATLAALIRHWRECGRPEFAQFDNDSIFQGSHGHRGQLGRLVHACLCLGVTPVFTPPRETGFQGKIEAFNRRWQEAVWQRFRFRSYAELQQASRRFIAAHRQKHACTLDTAQRLPTGPLAEAREPIVHRVIFLRRATAESCLDLLQQRIRLPSTWQHRLVRCEIDLATQSVACYGLRRRAPAEQPLLSTHPIQAKLTPWHSPPR